MTGHVPKGYRMAETVDMDIYLSDGYRNWTVADLIEMLKEFPKNAPVFTLEDPDTDVVNPIEAIAGGPDGVFL